MLARYRLSVAFRTVEVTGQSSSYQKGCNLHETRLLCFEKISSGNDQVVSPLQIYLFTPAAQAAHYTENIWASIYIGTPEENAPFVHTGKVLALGTLVLH